jgi:hypothetical protein
MDNLTGKLPVDYVGLFIQYHFGYCTRILITNFLEFNAECI